MPAESFREIYCTLGPGTSLMSPPTVRFVAIEADSLGGILGTLVQGVVGHFTEGAVLTLWSSARALLGSL